MRNEANVAMEQQRATSRVAHVVERLGLAMAGMLCGLFVAADLIRANVHHFDSVGYVLTMCAIGMAGFYLGIDMPRIGVRAARFGKGRFPFGVNPVEWLSASGTFLAAMAAMVSVSTIILDETPQLALTVIVGCGWLFGATMQVGAGALARLHSNRRTAG